MARYVVHQLIQSLFKEPGLLDRLKNSSDPQVAKSAGEQLEGLPMLKKYGTVAQLDSEPQAQPTASVTAEKLASTPSPISLIHLPRYR